MKHTKGTLLINTVFNSKGIAIPKVFDSKGPLFILVDGLKTERENLEVAQLIAAAPDMYEAAEKLLYRLQVCLDDLNQSGEASFDAYAEMKKLESILKKARGES